MRLWESDHPYYMNEGNYYKSGEHTNYECLDDFLAGWGDADIDMNRVHRWDWSEGVMEGGDDSTTGVLSIYFVLQRKARLMSCNVKVTRADEPKVIEYLSPHAELNARIWSPMLKVSEGFE